MLSFLCYVYAEKGLIWERQQKLVNRASQEEVLFAKNYLIENENVKKEGVNFRKET